MKLLPLSLLILLLATCQVPDTQAPPAPRLAVRHLLEEIATTDPLQGYYADAPRNVAPFSGFRIHESTHTADRKICELRHLHGHLEIFHLRTAHEAQCYLGFLTGPTPGEQFLYLVTEDERGIRTTATETVFTRGDIAQEPDFAILPRADEDWVRYRGSDGVIDRYSITTHLYAVRRDSLIQLLAFREFSEEGPGYRGDQPADSLTVVLRRKLQIPTGRNPRQIRIEGEVSAHFPNTATEAIPSGPYRFTENYRWDEERGHFTVEAAFRWHVDARGQFRPFPAP
ncbi:MAG: hypothetical protein AAGN35_07400 [Bacteroidota bacterium]